MPSFIDADVQRLEKAAAGLVHEFGTLVSSYEDHATRTGQAAAECSCALLLSTAFMEEQLRGAMTSANSVLNGMVGMSSAFEGLEQLLAEIRRVTQDVAQVEMTLLAMEEEAKRTAVKEEDDDDTSS